MRPQVHAKNELTCPRRVYDVETVADRPGRGRHPGGLVVASRRGGEFRGRQGRKSRRRCGDTWFHGAGSPSPRPVAGRQEPAILPRSCRGGRSKTANRGTDGGTAVEDQHAHRHGGEKPIPQASPPWGRRPGVGGVRRAEAGADGNPRLGNPRRRAQPAVLAALDRQRPDLVRRSAVGATSNDVHYHGVEVWEGEGPRLYDAQAGVLVEMWLRQIAVHGLYHQATYWRLSRDFGKTWSPAKMLRYEPGDEFDPAESSRPPAYLNTNQGYFGNNILKLFQRHARTCGGLRQCSRRPRQRQTTLADGLAVLHRQMEPGGERLPMDAGQAGGNLAGAIVSRTAGAGSRRAEGRPPAGDLARLEYGFHARAGSFTASPPTAA